MAGRFELSERLKRLDVAWMNTTDMARRRPAVDSLKEAVGAYFAGRNSDAARSMDEALAKLENRKLRTADALNVRLDRPFAEPGATVTLKITWAYQPTSVIPEHVGVGSQEVVVRPGDTASLQLNPWIVSPELRLNQEVGYLMPVRVGTDTRFVYMSFVRKVDERLRRLRGSSIPFVTEMASLLDGYQGNPATQEVELPLVQFLFQAEALEDGKAKVSDLEQVYHARSGDTVFRAAFPKDRPAGALNVVVAIHGAGGSENMFFESYGRGLAVSEALKRGWAIVSPRAGANCVDDCLAWVAKVRNVAIGKVFLIGHSSGAGQILGGQMKTKPSGVALLAPGAGKIGNELSGVPFFVGVGKSDAVAPAVEAFVRANGSRSDFEFQEPDPCDHLMVVADLMPEVFRFFDRLK